ncbi:MAG: TonB-dependent receptor [Prevotellaceae bacterium]|nr:TonB-dependent receptor [Prevotellaceae bacterium]
MKKSLLTLTVLAGVATANAADPEEVLIDTLKAHKLQEVQIVSTRATKTTPVAYKDLTQQQIKEVNFGQDIPFLLSLTPSVTITSDAGNGIGYTSLRVRGTDPSRINITANGVPMNDAESSQLFWVNMSDFASSVQSMQIQRGVGTSTNGAGAFGATVNMQTENIGLKPYLGIDLSAGSYYSHKETVRFGTGLIKDHWGLQGRLSNIGSKGYLDRASTKLNSYFLQGGYFSDNTMVKFITFNGVEETYHAWNYTSKYEQSLYGRTYNSCGEYYDNDGNVHYYDNQTDNYHQQNYQLHWDQLINQNWNFNIALHYTKGQGYYEEYKTERTLAEYNLTTDWNMLGDLVRQKKMDNDFYGFVASINYKDNNGITANIGGGWNKYDGDHFGKVIWTGSPYYYLTDANGNDYKEYVATDGSIQPDFEYYRNNAKKTDMNIYGKINWAFYKGLSAYVDLQYRHVGYKMNGPTDDWNYGNTASENTQVVFSMKDNFDFFNPKFGLNWDITPNHKVYASYAIAHREPTRNDYEDNIGSSLNAEKLNDLEFGYKYMSKTFSAGANFYYMYYRDQFVLTGELNEIGEMIASNENSGKSYRMGVELEAAWQPVKWFRWDANATWSKNRAKDWTVTDSETGEAISLGDTPLSFSPDFIFNNIFSFNYKGFKASVQSQYISDQYLTNTGFKSYTNYLSDGTTEEIGMIIESHFTTNIDLSYNFSLKKFGMKDATIGVTLYNIFDAKYDNNGWAAPGYKLDANGKAIAYCEGDPYEAGFAPSAPFNFMAHLSLNF